MKRLTLALIAGCAFAQAAFAGPLGPRSVLDPDDQAWFYNRPSTTLDEFHADTAHCTEQSQILSGGAAPTPGQPNQYGLTGDIILAIVTAGPMVAYMDDCMIGLGYRRFDVAGLNQRQLRERLATASPETLQRYVSDQTPPEGVLIRQWQNTYWLPRESDGAQELPQRRRANDILNLTVSVGQWSRIEGTSEAPTTPPDINEALIVLRVRSNAPRQTTVYFTRANPETGQPDLLPSGRRDVLPMPFARLPRGASDQLFFIVAPAGTYSLSGIGIGGYESQTLFCMGTAAFLAEGGTATYLGEFTIDGTATAPEFAPPPKLRFRVDQDEAAAAMAALPPALGSAFTNASFVTEFPLACPPHLGFGIYGFDLPGATVWAPRSAASH